MSDKLIPLAVIEKIIKRVDSEIRVSDEAKVAMKAILEDKACEIAKRACQLAIHAGRKTVKKDDIKLAYQS